MNDHQALAGIVKPLVWGPYENPVFAGPDVAVAKVNGVVPFYYQAQKDPWAHSFLVAAATTHGAFVWESKGYPDIETAQAAAQADYAARILAAIDTDKIAALVKALETIALLSECRASRQEARTAVAAMKGQSHE